MIRPRAGKLPGPGRGNWNVTHGYARRGARIPEHRVWIGMMRRCTDPKTKSFSDYGGRGITVCERWKFFENFIADMGRRPTDKHSIERLNNDRGYEPDNCTWATHYEQSKNKRKRRLKTSCKHGHALTESNTYVRTNGKRQCKTCRRDALRRLQAKGYFKDRRNGTASASAE